MASGITLSEYYCVKRYGHNRASRKLSRSKDTFQYPRYRKHSRLAYPRLSNLRPNISKKNPRTIGQHLFRTLG